MSDCVEKVICCDRDNNNDWLPAMMMNGGFGANQWMNNPFAYLLFFSLFRNGGFGGWGGEGFGYGQGQQNIEMQNQLQAIRTQLSDNNNSQLIMDAIKGNGADIARLAQTLGCDFTTLNNALCDVRATLQTIGGKIGYSAEKVINAVERGDCNVIQAIKDCCCNTNLNITRMGYENQLGQKDIINGMQTGFDRTNTGLERGFAQVGYQAQQDKCDIIAAGTANTQRIIDTLNSHWKEEDSRKIQSLEFQLSQKEQNETLAKMIWQRTGGNCGCNNDCGCGCGQ